MTNTTIETETKHIDNVSNEYPGKSVNSVYSNNVDNE